MTNKFGPADCASISFSDSRLALLNLSIREPSMRSAKEEARASPNMALRSEKTRSALAEFGIMANIMRAAAAQVGNLWPLRHQKSKMEFVNASMLVVSTTTPTHAVDTRAPATTSGSCPHVVVRGMA